MAYRTTRNEQITNVAASAAHFTSDRDIARFVKSLPLAEIAMVEPVARELYGATTLVLNESRIARIWAARGLGRGFADAVHLAQQRIDAL